MKQIGRVIGVLVLLYLAYFGYKKYMQSQMPTSALLNISDQIDLDYHNEHLLLDYYDLTYALNATAKKTWFEYLEDITHSESVEPEFVEVQTKFLQKKVIRQRIEQKLIQSKKLKTEKQYDNFDVIQSENRQDYIKPKVTSIGNAVIYERGNENEGVLLVQNMLFSLGYRLRLDGVFRQETENVVKQYQKDKHLIESGYVDFKTYETLIKDTRSQNNE